jgi:hypothetical protein
MTAVPWLQSRVSESSFFTLIESVAYLYPPATILEFGHFELAKSKRVVAAPISVGLVF